MCIRDSFSVLGEEGRTEGVEAMRQAGVRRIMVPAFFFAGPDGLERLEEFGESVVKLTAD